MLQLLSTDQEGLQTIYFLHLLQIAGDEANVVRSSLSDETFKLLVHRSTIPNVPFKQVDADSGQTFPAGSWVRRQADIHVPQL